MDRQCSGGRAQHTGCVAARPLLLFHSAGRLRRRTRFSLPDEGGLYVWTREAFGGFAGFIAAWTYWMSNLPYFPAVLYFGAASVLFAFGLHGQSLSSNPAYYLTFAIAWLGIITEQYGAAAGGADYVLLLTGARVTDTSSGYRAMRAESPRLCASGRRSTRPRSS